MRNQSICLIALFVLSFSSIFASTQKKLTIYFKSGDYHILASEKSKIDSMKNATMLLLCGHTDADGSPGSNYILSEKRVKEVYASLQKMGIDKDKMRIDYQGEIQPITSNVTDEEKALNRRVEIIYSEDPMLALKVATQRFMINNQKDTVFILKEGTKVSIPANAFEGKKVDLSIREFVSKKSILAENLSTKSGTQNLETAGMLYMEARVDNQIVNPSKSISLTFKNTSGKTDFKFFEGVEKKDLGVDWVVKDSVIKPVAEKANKEKSKGYLGASFIYSDELDNFLNLFFDSLNKNNIKDKYYSSLSDTSLKYSFKFNENGTINTINSRSIYEIKNSKEYSALLNYIPKSYDRTKVHGSTILELELFFYDLSNIAPLMKNYYEEYEAHNDMEEIVLKTNNLGWINCDRFATDKREKIAYAVKADEDVNVRMIMKSQKSFFNPHQLEKNPTVRYFGNTPVGEKIILIATVRRDDKILLAIAETTTSKTPFSDLKFEEVSLEELEKRIDKLNI